MRRVGALSARLMSGIMASYWLQTRLRMSSIFSTRIRRFRLLLWFCSGTWLVRRFVVLLVCALLWRFGEMFRNWFCVEPKGRSTSWLKFFGGVVSFERLLE